MKKHLAKITTPDFGLDDLITIPFIVFINNFRHYVLPFAVFLASTLLFWGLGFVFILVSGLDFELLQEISNNPGVYSSQEVINLLEPAFPAIILMVVIIVPVSILLGVFIENLLTITSHKILTGKEVKRESVFEMAKDRLPAAIATALALLMILIAVFVLVSIVFVVSFALGPFAIILICCLIIALIPLSLFLGSNILFAQTVTILEPVAFVDAIVRSRDLVKANIGKVMLFVLVIGFVSGVLSIPLNIIEVILDLISSAFNFSVITAVMAAIITTTISSVISYVVQVIFNIGRTAWYLNLKHSTNDE